MYTDVERGELYSNQFLYRENGSDRNHEWILFSLGESQNVLHHLE